MEEFIEELERSSEGCLDKGTINLLRKVSVKVVKSIKVHEDTYIKLPNGLVAVIPSTQLPFIWLNILHIFCFRDYSAYDDFIPSSDWVVIDVGASIGLYTLYVSSFVRKGKIIAVEPASLPRKYLRLNVELNDLSNVVIDSHAVAPKSGSLKLYVTRYWATTSAMKSYADYMSEVIKVETVNAVTLDELLSNYGLDRVDLIKLDIEGYEDDVIRSSEVIRERKVRRLVVEVHKNVVSPSNILNYLRSVGYEVILHDVGLENQVFIYARS